MQHGIEFRKTDKKEQQEQPYIRRKVYQKTDYL